MPKGPTSNRTDALNVKRREKFLQHLAECGQVLIASAAARIPKRTLYTWRNKMPEFRAAWDEALDKAADVLEDEATRRALVGVDEPVFHKGGVCGHVRKYSDTLLIFLLKGRRPERFRDNHAIEHTGRNGAPLPAAIEIKLVSPQ